MVEYKHATHCKSCRTGVCAPRDAAWEPVADESELRSEKGKEMREPPQEIGQRAFAFAVRVVKLCRAMEKTPGVSRTLANQLLRSGTSIGANLEESKGGQSRADFLPRSTSH